MPSNFGICIKKALTIAISGSETMQIIWMIHHVLSPCMKALNALLIMDHNRLRGYMTHLCADCVDGFSIVQDSLDISKQTIGLRKR